MRLLSFSLADEARVHVYIAAGARRELGRLAGELLGAEHVLLVVDSGVPGGLVEELVEGLSGLRVSRLVLPGGEASKTLETVEALWDWMLREEAARDSLLVAVGGGALTDTAGFAAATFMRGIPWATVPTTLLGMADAAMGGKTAVNYAGKNIVGAFHHPVLVVSDVEFVSTLPDREYRSGLAEVVKHAVIAGEEALAGLEALAAALLERRLDAVAEAVEMSARVKMGIVSLDPRETRGERMKLNLGHTFAHALERASGYRIPHGYAVAVGLNVEGIVAERLLGLDRGDRLRVKTLLERLGLPTVPPAEPGCDGVVEYVRLDKKRRGPRLVLPLPRRPGRVELVRLGLGEARGLLHEACLEARREGGMEP